MVLFLLISVPFAYLFFLQFQGENTDYAHHVRNPLVIGAASFFLFYLVGIFVWQLFTTEYRWADAFLLATISDQILPFLVASILFAWFFRRSFYLEPALQGLVLTSFLTGFLGMLAIRDLIAAINELSPVELFYRPLGRLCLLFILTWSLRQYRLDSTRWRFLFVNVLVVHLFIGFAAAAQRMNQPFLALFLMIVPVAEATILIVRPGMVDTILKRKSTA
jgi:hypothetical protein